MTSGKMPIVTWETGIHHEALRLIYHLKRLPEQEMQRRGFLVLPAPVAKHHNRIVVLPDLPYNSIPHLWDKCSHLAPTTPMSAPTDLVDQVVTLLRPTYHEPRSALTRFQSDWAKIEANFFKSIFSLLPHAHRQLTRLNVIICHCGSCSQFNILRPDLTTLTVYLRADSTITDLTQVIVLSLIRHQLQYVEKRSWEEIETVSDFLLAHTNLNSSLKPFDHLTMMPRLQQTQSGPLLQQSLKYQTHLGIPTLHHWHVRGDQIFYQDIKIEHLTQRQSKLLALLIKNIGEVVTNDQLSQILWPDNADSFSLWAIVKEVARIRACLKAANLPGSLLQSHRKMGYSLS